MFKKIKAYLGEDKGIIKGVIGGVVATVAVVVFTNIWVGLVSVGESLRLCSGLSPQTVNALEREGVDAFNQAHSLIETDQVDEAQFWYLAADVNFKIASENGSIVAARRRGVLNTSTASFRYAREDVAMAELCKAAIAGDRVARSLIEANHCASSDQDGWPAAGN